MNILIKKAAIFSIFIGIIGLSLNYLFGNSTITYLQMKTINGVRLYTFDFLTYLQNLKIATADTSKLQLATITRTWNNTGDWNSLINNLAYILDVIIYGLNILIYPVRVIAYVMKAMLAIAGVDINNTGSGLYWLINTMNVLMQTQIPYV